MRGLFDFWPRRFGPNRRAARVRRRLTQLRDRLESGTRVRLDDVLIAFEDVCRDAFAGDLPEYAREAMGLTIDHLCGIAERTIDLADRRAELNSYLFGMNLNELRGQQASLRVRGEAADDPIVRDQLADALRFKTEEIAAYEAITLARTRIDGQLESVACAFAALRARLRRLKSDEKTEWTIAGRTLESEIGSLTGQMDALDRSVREVLALGVGASAR